MVYTSINFRKNEIHSLTIQSTLSLTRISQSTFLYPMIQLEYISCFCLHFYSYYCNLLISQSKFLGPENLLQDTVQILCIGTDRSQQTVQTKIRLLLKKQSDQGLHCLPFHQHLLDVLMQCYIKIFYFYDNYGNCLRCPKF